MLTIRSPKDKGYRIYGFAGRKMYITLHGKRRYGGTDDGEVEEVVTVGGYGMLIGNENNPFPKYCPTEI